MRKHKKMKNVVYITLLAVFLIVVGIRTFQNISLIQKITQSPGIEDASIESNLLIFASEGCFLEDTAIKTPTMSIMLRDIKIGDAILGFDSNGNTVENKVEKIFKLVQDNYYILETSLSAVNATSQHPFYTPNGYKTVTQLKVGDSVYVLVNGKLVQDKIISKQRVDKEITVYNLQVSGTNTFFANIFAVHNKCPSCTGQACGGCSGTCSGSCSSGYTCQYSGGRYSCVVSCTPNCTNKTCGDNGCGGSCGTCASGYVCSSGTCISCTSNPTVGITPSSQSGMPGQSLIYTINVTNNDNSVCNSTLFSLANTCPSGWTCTLSKNSVTIAAQASDVSSITVISATSAQDGSNPFSVTAANQTYSESGTGSATYVVNKNLNCDNHALDNYCSGTENQTYCPADCKTTVSMTPSSPLIVGTPVQITIFFSDGRYLVDHNVQFNLVIDGNAWDVNYCQYQGAILSKNGGSGTIKWHDSTVSKNYNFTTTLTCQVPPGLSSGSHTLSVTPTIYSSAITLRAVQVDFSVANQTPDLSSYIASFIASVKSFLGIK